MKTPTKVTYLKRPRTCDYCRESAAFYCSTKGGAWAWLCPTHHKERASTNSHASGYRVEIER